MATKIFFLSIFILATASLHSQSKVIAHRGFSAIAPENTLTAFQKAIDMGADYFELDIHKSLDDSLMVIHDDNIGRTSSNSFEGKVSELTYAEISKARVGYQSRFLDTFSNEKIPTLRESLLLAKGKIKVCIEIKVLGVEEDVLKNIYELGVENEVIIFSFHYPVLAKIRMLDPTIKTLYLMSKADALTPGYAKVIQANAIGVGSQTSISKEFLALVHSEGLEVWKWTVDGVEEINELVRLGVDGIITNVPDAALVVVNSLK